MDEDDSTYGVNERETIQRLAEERGLDLSFLEYEQTIIEAYTRRQADGHSNKFCFQTMADKVCTQEEFEEEINEALDEMERQISAVEGDNE